MNRALLVGFLLLACLNHVSAQEMVNKTDSLDIMIGQMLMVGMQGKSLEDDLGVAQDLNQGLIGGVIIYEKNIDPTEPWISVKKLTNAIQNNTEIPAFIAIDQEGGRVNRLKTKYGFPPSKTASYLGEINNLDSTRFYAQLTASTLKGLGINTNFAPDVDVNVNPDNPVIGSLGRSYSSDPMIVANHASIVVEEHRNNQILTTLKHFPGHGSSRKDTHLDMVDVSDSWIEEELEPYKSLIEQGMADGIMTAHIVQGNLDSLKLPGTLSHKTVQELLRDSLGFEGLVFSDDMHMKAISTHYGLESAIELSINAGVDILLFSNNIANISETTGEKVHTMIRQMVFENRIPYSRIAESYTRILETKRKFGIIPAE